MTEIEYQEALHYLFEQTPNYQIQGKKAYKPSLENIRKLCEFFGTPQDKIKTVHIGGTNGKGSTSNMLASILQEAGYKVGLYNSPHLIDFTERVKVNGKPCDKEFVYEFIQKLKKRPSDILPSFFEFTTVLGFEYFWEQNVDIAIIEVGLGGRLDSTNIITPLVSAITNVQLDHMNILGDTIEQIAQEKAGIVKKNIPIISGDDNPVVKQIIFEKAKEYNAPFIDVTQIEANYQSDLKGNYQKKNIKVVLALVKELQNQHFKIKDEDIERGLMHVREKTGFIGRWYQFSSDPLIICDTAHNQAGLLEVFNQLSEYAQKKHIVLGFVNDKKIDEVLQLLPKDEAYYFVQPAIERGSSPWEYEALLNEARLHYRLFTSVQDGYEAARKAMKNQDMMFIGGSNFVVGEFLEKKLHFHS